jgi:hypothetical protein
MLNQVMLYLGRKNSTLNFAADTLICANTLSRKVFPIVMVKINP